VKRRNKLVSIKSREVNVKNVSRYRAMGSLHRQCAVFDPLNSWKHLGEAERWEHLAEAEIASHFKECNTTAPDDLANSDISTRWTGVAA
jgi:hypothetical protein